MKMVTAPPVQTVLFISWHIYYYLNMDLLYNILKCMGTLPRCKQENIVSTILGLAWTSKAVWSDWAGTPKHWLPEPCVTQEGHNLLQESSRVQACPPALAGLSVPAFLLWDGLCQQHPQAAQVLVHRLMLSEGRGSFAFSSISACFQPDFFLFLPGLRVGTGEDRISLFYCHGAKAGHICNPNILSVSPCVTHFKHLYLQKLNRFSCNTSGFTYTKQHLASNLQLFNPGQPALTLFSPSHLNVSAIDCVTASVACQEPIWQLTCCSTNTYWHSVIPAWCAPSFGHKWVIGGTGLAGLFSILLQDKMQSHSEICSGIDFH